MSTHRPATKAPERANDPIAAKYFYEPGNATRYEVLIAKAAGSERTDYDVVLTNFSKHARVDLQFPVDPTWLAHKLGVSDEDGFRVFEVLEQFRMDMGWAILDEQGV